MSRGSAQEWLACAESCRERAALYRSVIERAERPGGPGHHPRWPEIKEILLELAEELEREADETEAHGAEQN